MFKTLKPCTFSLPAFLGQMGSAQCTPFVLALPITSSACVCIAVSVSLLACNTVYASLIARAAVITAVLHCDALIQQLQCVLRGLHMIFAAAKKGHEEEPDKGFGGAEGCRP